MVKYKQEVQQMIADHELEFKEFGAIHDKYKQDQEKWQVEFNRIGKPVLRIIEETENRLCGKMEGAGKGKFSASLAEKFRSEVRLIFPLVDWIGMTIE